MEATLNLSNNVVEEITTRIILIDEKLTMVLESLSMQKDEILTVEETAALLSVSKEQIYQWVDKAKHGFSDFPYMKCGRSLRFSRKSVIEWMRTNAKRLEKR